MLDTMDLLFGKPLKVTEKVSLHVPTVEDVAYTEKYSAYTQPFITTTRQMFSSLAEVDKLEAEFPTIWGMAFHEEGNVILGQMFGGETGINIIIEALSYWTKLDVESFKALSNRKIVNKEANWIIDEEVFNSIGKCVKEIIGYEPDLDLIAPKNMSERQLDIWKKTYKGRMRNRQKNSITFADKIMILSISMDAYIPIDEIRKMTIYYFNKLYEGLSEKESYEKQWEVKMSPKFDSGNGTIKHWKESFKG